MNNLSRKERLLQYRKQSRFPRYNLAEKNTNSGRQSWDYDPVELYNNPGEDLSGDINTMKQNILPNALSTGVNSLMLGSQLGEIGKSVYKDLFGKSLVDKAFKSATDSFVNAMGKELTNQIATNGLEKASISAVNKAGNSAAQTALGESAKNTAKTLSTIGSAANYAAAAYGLYDLTKSLATMGSNTRSSADMMDATSRQLDYRNGVGFERVGGINYGQEMKYAGAQNLSDTIGNTVKGASTGFAIGSIFPGLGNVIGAGIGALIGGVGSIFGGNARKRRVEQIINNTNLSIADQNKQNESVASSQGLRNQFYQNNYDSYGMLNADRGFNPSNALSKNSNVYRQVWTPEGKQFGEQGSWVGKGESQIDYDNGTASIVKEGKVGVDNVPSSAKEGDNITIAGNDIDWNTGDTFAREVAPHTAVIEEINKKERAIQNSNASQKTKEINMFNLRKAKQPHLMAAKQFTDRQQMQHQIEGMYGQPQYNCGKRGYAVGKEALQYLPYLFNLGIANKRYNTYKNAVPTAKQSFVPNQYIQPGLNALAAMYYDVQPELNAARDAYRQGLYINNNSGALSAGQRAAANTALGIGLMNNRSVAYAKAQDAMNKYRQAWAQSAIQAGGQEAARMQQSQAAYNDQLAASYANRLRGMETADNSKASVYSAFAKHMFDKMQLDRALDIQNRWLRMYDNPDSLQSNNNSKTEVSEYNYTPNETSYLNRYFPKYELKKPSENLFPSMDWKTRMKLGLFSIPNYSDQVSQYMNNLSLTNRNLGLYNPFTK